MKKGKQEYSRMITEWEFDRIKEAFEKVAKDEARKLSTVQKIMFKSTDCLRRIIEPVGGQGGVTMSYLCPNCNSSPLEDYVWWVSAGKKHTSWWCAICEKSTAGGNRTGFWSYKLGKVLSSAKVFKARAVPQGLCGNLINALKLLANKKEDGDGLIQNIVTNLCEGSRKGLTEGLREFIQIDNDRALEVGHLREGLGTFKVRRPKGPEGHPEVTVRESRDKIDASSRGSGHVEVIHQRRPHSKGEVASSPGRC